MGMRLIRTVTSPVDFCTCIRTSLSLIAIFYQSKYLPLGYDERRFAKIILDSHIPRPYSYPNPVVTTIKSGWRTGNEAKMLDGWGM